MPINTGVAYDGAVTSDTNLRSGSATGSESLATSGFVTAFFATNVPIAATADDMGTGIFWATGTGDTVIGVTRRPFANSGWACTSYPATLVALAPSCFWKGPACARTACQVSRSFGSGNAVFIVASNRATAPAKSSFASNSTNCLPALATPPGAVVRLAARPRPRAVRRAIRSGGRSLDGI